MKTDLELALDCIISIYHQYTPKKPTDDYMNRDEFSALLKENAQPFLHDTVPPKTSINDYINQLFTKADTNHNGCLKFTEFMTTLNRVFIDAHNRCHEHPAHPDAGHGHDHGHSP